MLDVRGVAQPGSASALGAEGREFESHRPDHFNPLGSFNHLNCFKYNVYLHCWWLFTNMIQ